MEGEEEGYANLQESSKKKYLLSIKRKCASAHLSRHRMAAPRRRLKGTWVSPWECAPFSLLSCPIGRRAPAQGDVWCEMQNPPKRARLPPSRGGRSRRSCCPACVPRPLRGGKWHLPQLHRIPRHRRGRLRGWELEMWLAGLGLQPGQRAALEKGRRKYFPCKQTHDL